MTARSARAIGLSALARAFADIVLYAYLPVHLYAVLGEQRFAVISLILAVPNLARFAAAGLWGAALDRTGRTRPFLLLGMAAYTLSLAALSAMRDPALTVLTVCALAVPASAYNPSARGYLTRWPGDGGRALAGWLRAETAGWLAGGLAMAFAAGRHPAALPVTGAVLALSALVALCTVPEPPRGPAGRPTGPRGGLAGLDPLVWRTAGYVGMAVMLAEAVFAVFGIYLTQFLGGPEWLYGAAITGSTVTALLIYGPLTRAASAGRAPVLLLAAAAGYVVSFALALARSPWVVAASFTLPMFAAVRVGATWLAAAGSDEGSRGRAMGAIESAEAVAAALGSLGGGLLADAAGARAVIGTALGLSLVLLPLAAAVGRRAAGAA